MNFLGKMRILKVIFFAVHFIESARDSSATQLVEAPIKPRFSEHPAYDHLNSNITQCLRDCKKELEPRTCYYSFHLEHYTSNNGACNLCKPNSTTQLRNDCQCILGDGVERYVKVINRMLPGPSIQVCVNDTVIIDVLNLLDGEDAAIHWHGILQKGTQYSDGVPFVTQCPIPSGTTFRYQWIAQRAGTNFWHSHTGLQEMDGVYGSLIIRESEDPHDKLYDEDKGDHVMVVSDWMHEGATEHFPGKLVNGTGQNPKTFLLNGMGWNHKDNASEYLSMFEVLPGKNYRFRFINAVGSACPSRLNLEGHKMKVIATDGNPIEPVIVDVINSFSGERYDFIVRTDRPSGSYWIELTGLGECAKTAIHQVAVLRYSGNKTFVTEKKPISRDILPDQIVLNPFEQFGHESEENLIGISKLKSLQDTDITVVGENVSIDYKIYLSFKFEGLEDEKLFRPHTFETFLVGPNGGKVRSLINNITSVFPPSPYISQYSENPSGQFCNFMDEIGKHETDRTCSHVIPISLNSVVELIIVDEVQRLNIWHPFHLHGTDFYVLGMNSTATNPKVNMTRDAAMQADKQGKLHRNFDRPVRKDTLAVPRDGYIIVRFRADNPGFWLLHCHFQYHMIIGMHLVIAVGELSDLPPIPKGFPKCGNYKPAIVET